MFGEMVPMRAHNIFDDFFGNRMMCWGDDDFKPLFHNKWTKDMDQMMMMDEDDEKMMMMKDGQTVKTNSVWTKKNGKESMKTMTTKKTMKNGKVNTETTEDYLFPNGERNIVRTMCMDGKVDTKKYTLKKGEEMPKELCN